MAELGEGGGGGVEFETFGQGFTGAFDNVEASGGDIEVAGVGRSGKGGDGGQFLFVLEDCAGGGFAGGAGDLDDAGGGGVGGPEGLAGVGEGQSGDCGEFKKEFGAVGIGDAVDAGFGNGGEDGARGGAGDKRGGDGGQAGGGDGRVSNGTVGGEAKPLEFLGGGRVEGDG